MLRAELTESANLKRSALETQIHETIRCLKMLPPAATADGGKVLLQTLQADYHAREVYLGCVGAVVFLFKKGRGKEKEILCCRFLVLEKKLMINT